MVNKDNINALDCFLNMFAKDDKLQVLECRIACCLWKYNRPCNGEKNLQPEK